MPSLLEVPSPLSLIGFQSFGSVAPILKRGYVRWNNAEIAAGPAGARKTIIVPSAANVLVVPLMLFGHSNQVPGGAYSGGNVQFNMSYAGTTTNLLSGAGINLTIVAPRHVYAALANAAPLTGGSTDALSDMTGHNVETVIGNGNNSRPGNYVDLYCFYAEVIPGP